MAGRYALPASRTARDAPWLKSVPRLGWKPPRARPRPRGRGVQPIVHRAYDGRDIVLPGDATKVIRVRDNPCLETLQGNTLVTSDGTTLLGADDKAGVAVIMEAAKALQADPQITHGAIRLCFTCDEEIGRGVDHLDLNNLGADVGYTLDGGGQGEIDGETFS